MLSCGLLDRLHLPSQSRSSWFPRSWWLGSGCKIDPQLNSCLISAYFTVGVYSSCLQCRNQTRRIRDRRTLHLLHRLLGRIIRLHFSYFHCGYFFLTTMPMMFWSFHHHLGRCCSSSRDIQLLCDLSVHICSIICPSSNLRFGWCCWVVLWFAMRTKLHLILARLSS